MLDAWLCMRIQCALRDQQPILSKKKDAQRISAKRATTTLSEVQTTSNRLLSSASLIYFCTNRGVYRV